MTSKVDPNGAERAKSDNCDDFKTKNPFVLHGLYKNNFKKRRMGK